MLGPTEVEGLVVVVVEPFVFPELLPLLLLLLLLFVFDVFVPPLFDVPVVGGVGFPFPTVIVIVFLTVKPS